MYVSKIITCIKYCMHDTIYVRLFIYLSIYLPICLSIYLSIYLVVRIICIVKHSPKSSKHFGLFSKKTLRTARLVVFSKEATTKNGETHLPVQLRGPCPPRSFKRVPYFSPVPRGANEHQSQWSPSHAPSIWRKLSWETKNPGLESFSGWWLNQPIWKICSSNWIMKSPNRGENKKYLSCHHPVFFPWDSNHH